MYTNRVLLRSTKHLKLIYTYLFDFIFKVHVYKSRRLIDIDKAYTSDLYYTGQATLKDTNNRQDVLYLIYGHEFSHRVMNYEYGKLEGVSTYYDKGDNPVLLELYKDGDLIEQSSGVHIVSGEGIEWKVF